jgi:hypothetical protein
MSSVSPRLYGRCGTRALVESKTSRIPRIWYGKCRTNWHSPERATENLDTMEADRQRHAVTIPHKLRQFLTNLAGVLPRGTSDARRAAKKQIQEMGGAIIDHGRMVSQFNSHRPVGVEVKELAFRFRETTHNIVTALVQLEREGRASRTRFAGYWILRVQPQKNNKEVFKGHEDQ